MRECGEAGVPWDDSLRFCESVDAAIVSVAGMFRDDWRDAVRRVYDWAKDAGFEPFAAAVRLALDREMPAETVRTVFRSLCDHRQSLFAQKAAAIIGWAEATAGLGPTGNPDDDVALWAGAWDVVGEAPLKTDIHGACLQSIIQALKESGGKETGIRVCDEFLHRCSLPGTSPQHTDDAERAIFSVSVLKDSLTVAENLHSTYKGLFGGVLDILYWPAMAGCAATRIRASLAGDRSLPGAVSQARLGGGICERKTSSVIPQAASLTQEAPCASSA